MLAYLAVVAVAIFMAGLWWFRRLKSFFDTRL
jgi:lipopolysaccharide transport system permease protein